MHLRGRPSLLKDPEARRSIAKRSIFGRLTYIALRNKQRLGRLSFMFMFMSPSMFMSRKRDVLRSNVLFRFQKKRRPLHTDTHTQLNSHSHSHAPPTSYYTDGTHFGFHDWDPTPQPQPHACTVGPDRHVVAAATATVLVAVLYAVSCALCPVAWCATFTSKGCRCWAFSDTSSRLVTDDALVYRCLVSSSVHSKRGTWQRPCTWGIPPPSPRPRCRRPRCRSPIHLCCPGRCPRRRTPCHQGTQTQRHRSVVERLGPHLRRGSTLECHDGGTRNDIRCLLQPVLCCTVLYCTVTVAFLPFALPGMSVAGDLML